MDSKRDRQKEESKEGRKERNKEGKRTTKGDEFQGEKIQL